MKKIFVCAMMLVLAMFCFCACGTVTTEQAGEYVDEGEIAETAATEPGVCTIEIECCSVLNHLELLDSAKKDIIPQDGYFLAKTEVAFEPGDTVLDILKKVTKENNLHMEYEDSPAYDGGYVEGIGNLYEYECGDLSGWDYYVNGWDPNYGCGKYQVSDGDAIQWRYTCELGKDIQ